MPCHLLFVDYYWHEKVSPVARTLRFLAKCAEICATANASRNLIFTLTKLKWRLETTLGAHGRAAGEMTTEQKTVVDHSLAERRRYRRERVGLPGRHFEPAENREAACKIADLSPGGACVLTEVVPPTGTHVVVYIDGFGRFEGNVTRTEEGSFGIEFNCTAHKRERVAQQLMLYVDGMPLEETTLRRHDRTKADGTKADGIVNFTRANGEIVECKVLDYSISGVYLITEARPAVGEFVLISKVPGRVARHHENGIAIEFTSHEQVVVEPPRTKLFATG